MAALSHEVDELQASLERRFRVTETRVDLSSRTLVIRHPANADDLISEEDFVRDDRGSITHRAGLRRGSRFVGGGDRRIRRRRDRLLRGRAALRARERESQRRA
jgi:hypothetical protein